jgi:pyrroloquinoline quinone biosynthesis protein D
MNDAPQDDRVPSLKRGMKFRFDTVRDAWVLLGPERLFVPDEQAVEVLKLVDGTRTLGGIVDDLCARFSAPREVVQSDVAAMLDDLAAKGVMTW